MRKTKIISTVGPKTQDKGMIERLADAGTSIIRLNMSHGSHEWHQDIIDKVKEINKKLDVPLGIMIDTTGPEIRTDTHGEGDVGVEEGDIIKIAVSSACDVQEEEKHTHVDCEELVKDVKKGDTLLVDDGLIALEVINVDQYHLNCRVLNKGKLGDRKCLNIPGIKVNIPAITDKDKKDLELFYINEIDFVAQSFVRRKEDALEMRKLLEKAKNKVDIIAKIEDADGIKNIDEILEVVDGIMIARGDLGVEMPLEEIPIIQRVIIKKCRKAGKPVIVATHLLESMVTNPRPTRAEVTDVANAVFERSDCLMLSSETTKGEYPIECVKTLAKIASKVQNRFGTKIIRPDKEVLDVKDVITMGACINAESLKAKAIIVFTKTGKLLRRVSKHRPNSEIFAVTKDKEVVRKLGINWGTYPIEVVFKDDFEDTCQDALKVLKKRKLIEKDDLVVVVSNIRPTKDVDVMEIRKIG